MTNEPPPPAPASPVTPPSDAPEPSSTGLAPGTLPFHLLEEPLRGQIEWIQRRHGLTPSAASLAVLATVLCAGGPSRRIVNPIDGHLLPPAFSMVLYGCPPAYIQAAVELGLDTIRNWMLRRIGPTDKRQLRRSLLHLGELHQARIGKEFEINSRTVGSSTRAAGFDGALKTSELEAQKKILEAELAGILHQINDASFLLRPHLLVDDASLPRLLNPGSLSTDGAVLHASLSGHAVTMWAAANKTTKIELARLLNLAWYGLPDAGDEDCHVSPLISNALVLDAAGARSLSSDRDLTSAGVIQHLFFTEASTADTKLDPGAGCPEEVVKAWTAGLQAILTARLSGQLADHCLDRPAGEIFEAYAGKLLTDAYASEPKAARRLGRTPVLALKLALLIHAISPSREDQEVGEKTIDFACALANAVSIGDLEFTDSGKPTAAIVNPAPTSADVTKLVTKLRLRGPLPWRVLLRSFRCQKAEPLELLLTRAIAAGVVRKEGELYQAVEPA